MRGAQDSSMMDACEIHEFQAGVVDVYGMPAEGYFLKAVSECGFDANAHKEVMDGTQVAITDARIRLPDGTAIGNKDRIKITHRYGTLQAEQPVFELIGEARRGASGVVCDLRLATKGV